VRKRTNYCSCRKSNTVSPATTRNSIRKCPCWERQNSQFVSMSLDLFKLYLISASFCGINKGRGSAVCIATGHGLDDRGSEFESLCVQEFTLLHIIQTSLGPIQLHLQMFPGLLCPDVKGAGHKADHAPTTNVEGKITWIYTSTLQYDFMELNFSACRFRNAGFVFPTLEIYFDIAP
jgi:hypothetical protein